MEQSLGLRLYVAYRITAGVIIGGLGVSILWMGGTTGDTVPFVGSVVVLMLSLFAALVVALEGAIVLIERTVASLSPTGSTAHSSVVTPGASVASTSSGSSRCPPSTSSPSSVST